jgi:tRNA A-37 threonylcarbamoyl transferase component Bud32
MNLPNIPSEQKSEDLFQQTGLSLRQAGRSPSLPFCIKLNDGQTVHIVRLLRILPGKRITGEGFLGTKRVLIKLFIAKNSQRHWLREQAGIMALHEAGLQTPKQIAALPLEGGGHALLTEFLDSAQTLDCCSKSTDPSTLISAFMLLGKLHAAGLLHNDIHPGNFLYSMGILYIIDGDAVRLVKQGYPVPESKALRNLAALLALFPGKQADFLNVYRQYNPSFRTGLKQVEKTAHKIRQIRITNFLKKSVRDCTNFSVCKNFRRFTAVSRGQQLRLDSLQADPDRAIDNSPLLKDGGSSTVALVQLTDGHCVVKRYNIKDRRHAFSRFWRPSRAWHSWKTALRLQCIGICTPEPLALIEERFGPFRRRAWLITEFCPGTHLLNHLSPDREPSPTEGIAITSLFNTLHRERISHGDLKATNLLWHNDQLLLIDLDAAKKHRFATTQRRAWEKDRSRFLHNWPSDCILFRWLDAHLPS